MLDLQSRIHFQEIETLVLPRDELDRAGAVVADRLRQRDRLLSHFFASRGIEQRRRRLLDDLLIAALDRAFALAEVDDIAVLVAKHLNFDMARIRDELFDENALIAERRLCLRARARKPLLHVGLAVRNAHALAAAPRARLDHDGIADLLRNPDGLRFIFDHPKMTGDGRHLGSRGRLLQLDLVAHRRDRLRVRPDKDDAGSRQRFRKRLALGEKTVARVHGLRAALLAGGDDLFDHQVAFGGRRRADRDRAIRHSDVERVAVGLRVDGDRFDAQLARGLDDPAGDFAAIGDQDTLEHAVSVAPGAGYLACCVNLEKSITATASGRKCFSTRCLSTISVCSPYPRMAAR